MENSNFDNYIKGHLKDLEIDFNPQDWDAMEQRLDADAIIGDDSVDDLYLDGLAYESLENLEQPYNPAHWDLMEQKLNQEYSFSNKLYKYKVIEAALMLLAIYTFIQFFPIQQKSSNSVGHYASTTAQDSTPLDLEENIVSKLDETTVNLEEATTINIIDKKSESNDILVEIKNQGTSANELITIATNASSIQQQQPSKDKGIGLAIADNQRIQTNLSYNKTVVNRVLLQNAKESLADINEANQKQQLTSIPQENYINAGANFSELEIRAPGLLAYQYPSDVHPCLPCDQEKKLKGFRVGMFAGANLNYIMTPYDITFSDASYNQIEYNYSGGITLGWKFKKWEVETGAIYASLQYAPKLNIHYKYGSFDEGYTGIGLRSAELNMLEIPFSILYKFKRYNKWQMYGLGGASFNYAYSANYDLLQYTIGRRENNGFRSNYDRITALSPDEFGRSYISANLGMGLERFFSSRWSLFFQPTYKHQLFSRGIGPNNDRLNTFSIFGGVKASLF